MMEFIWSRLMLDSKRIPLSEADFLDYLEGRWLRCPLAA